MQSPVFDALGLLVWQQKIDQQDVRRPSRNTRPPARIADSVLENFYLERAAVSKGGQQPSSRGHSSRKRSTVASYDLNLSQSEYDLDSDDIDSDSSDDDPSSTSRGKPAATKAGGRTVRVVKTKAGRAAVAATEQQRQDR